MHALVIGTLVAAAVAGGGAAAGLPQGNETPRATDLLRAKRMADEAAARLDMRPPKRGGWARGGTGWERSTAAPDRPEKDRLPSRRRVR
jgi:hypothetical protein